MQEKWFDDKECASLEIKKYKSAADHTVICSLKIEDRDVITELISRIEKIPADAAMMVSFSHEVENIDLFFNGKKGAQQIEIYGQRFKTPSTGFNTGKSEIEEGLYADIIALLSPDLGKKLLNVKNLTLRFKNFSVTYNGQNKRGEKGESVSFTDNLYTIRDKAGKEQHITITAGQISPQPYKFAVNKSKLTLLTYETRKKERLYADYFQIVK